MSNQLTLAPAPPSEAAEQVRLEVRAFLAEELAAGSFTTHVDTWLSGVDPEFSRKLGARGWLGMTWPREYGGHERSAMERYAVTEELLAAGAPVAAHWIADRQSGLALLRYGTEAQRKEILPRIAAGECYFVIGMSEPDSGSDLASIRTRATRNADGDLVVTGAKVWTSNAHHSHYGIVLVRTGPPGEGPRGKHQGLTQLLRAPPLPGPCRGAPGRPARARAASTRGSRSCSSTSRCRASRSTRSASSTAGTTATRSCSTTSSSPATCCSARRAPAGTRSPRSWRSSGPGPSGSCPPGRCWPSSPAPPPAPAHAA